MQERRDYERLTLDGNVSLKTENGNPRTFIAYLDNISFGGFAMHAQERIEVDRIVEFELMTQLLEQPLSGKGKIRHITTPEKYRTVIFTIGVEFIDINKDIVIYLMKRLQLKIVNEIRSKKQTKPLDFLPY